jgi:hypothetical protein
VRKFGSAKKKTWWVWPAPELSDQGGGNAGRFRKRRSPIRNIGQLSPVTAPRRPLIPCLLAPRRATVNGVYRRSLGPSGCGKSTLLRLVAGRSRAGASSAACSTRLLILQAAINRLLAETNSDQSASSGPQIPNACPPLSSGPRPVGGLRIDARKILLPEVHCPRRARESFQVDQSVSSVTCL